jgi:hypothetical protein
LRFSQGCFWRFKVTGYYSAFNGKYLPSFNRFVTLYLQAQSYQEESRLGLLDPKDEGATILRNVGRYVPVYRA